MENKEVILILADISGNQKQRYNKALKLFRKHKLSNQNLVRAYNRMGYSENNLKGLLYDLQNVYKISNKQLHGAISQIKSSKKEEETRDEPNLLDLFKGNEDLIDEILEFDLEKSKYKELQTLISKLMKLDVSKPEGRKKEDYVNSLVKLQEDILKALKTAESNQDNDEDEDKSNQDEDEDEEKTNQAEDEDSDDTQKKS